MGHDRDRRGRDGSGLLPRPLPRFGEQTACMFTAPNSAPEPDKPPCWGLSRPPCGTGRGGTTVPGGRHNHAALTVPITVP